MCYYLEPTIDTTTFSGLGVPNKKTKKGYVQKKEKKIFL